MCLFAFLAPCEEYPTWKRKEKILKTVSDWLHYIGLGNYESNFTSNGFDDLDFVGSDLVTRSDLKSIGIVNEQDISHLIDALLKKGPSKGKTRKTKQVVTKDKAIKSIVCLPMGSSSSVNAIINSCFKLSYQMNKSFIPPKN
jgi:hypothetical protein